MDRLKSILLANPRLLLLVLGPLGLLRGERMSWDGRRFTVRKGDRLIRLAARHAPYLRDVSREFDYYFESVVPQTEDGREVADFSEPRIHEIPGTGLEILFTSLPEGASTNETYMEFFTPAPGDVIVDAGAYCGLTAALFSRAVGPEGRVIAVEADPENHRALEANAQRLGLRNVTVVHAALWDEPGTVRFASEGNMGSSVATVAPREGATVEVEALTLEGLCERLGVQRVDHVKMDIEGAEYPVLRQAAAFIAGHGADVIVELHNSPAGRVDADDVVDAFAATGYSARPVKQSEHERFPLYYLAPDGQ